MQCRHTSSFDPSECVALSETENGVQTKVRFSQHCARHRSAMGGRHADGHADIPLRCMHCQTLYGSDLCEGVCLYRKAVHHKFATPDGFKRNLAHNDAAQQLNGKVITLSSTVQSTVVRSLAASSSTDRLCNSVLAAAVSSDLSGSIAAAHLAMYRVRIAWLRPRRRFFRRSFPPIKSRLNRLAVT